MEIEFAVKEDMNREDIQSSLRNCIELWISFMRFAFQIPYLFELLEKNTSWSSSIKISHKKITSNIIELNSGRNDGMIDANCFD